MPSKSAAAMLAGATLVAAPLVGIAGAGAQTPAAPAPGYNPILTRQAGYALMGAVAEAMKQGVRSGQSPKQYEDGASAMVDWSHVIPGLFPPGSEKGYDTAALPAIWSDRAGFDKAAAKLTAAATRLQAAAKADDKAAFAADFKATAASCGACHRTYKQRQ